MIRAALLLVLGGLPIGYPNIPNDGTAKCSQVDAELGRLLEKARDRHERAKIYFDLMQWPCENVGIWEAQWYSRALEAMGEPTFARRSNAKGFTDRLRLLAFSHSGAGYILRLDFRSDGAAILTFAESGWTSEKMDSRHLKEKWSQLVSPKDAAALLAEVDSARILRSGFKPDNHETVVTIDATTGEQTESICIEFAGALLERLDKRGRHTVAKTGCGQSEPIYPIIDAFHELIGRKPLTLEPTESPHSP
jgi:hypothetical protein